MNRARALLIMLLLLPACVSLATSQEQEEFRRESSANLDRAIEQVVNSPRYTWRLPREKPVEDDSDDGFWNTLSEWFDKGLRAMRRFVKRVFDWLDGLFPEPSLPPNRGGGWQGPLKIVMWALIGVLACVLGVAIYRLLKNRRRVRTETDARAAAPRPDIRDESTTGEELPADEWSRMAQDLLAAGELRLALRALFLGCLALLAQRERLSIARHKSNREYLRELDRRAHDCPTVLEDFAANTRMLEAVWYGTRTVTDEMMDEFTRNQERIRRAIAKV